MHVCYNYNQHWFSFFLSGTYVTPYNWTWDSTAYGNLSFWKHFTYLSGRMWKRQKEISHSLVHFPKMVRDVQEAQAGNREHSGMTPLLEPSPLPPRPEWARSQREQQAHTQPRGHRMCTSSTASELLGWTSAPGTHVNYNTNLCLSGLWSS